MDTRLELNTWIDQTVREAKVENLETLKAKAGLFFKAAYLLANILAIRYEAQRPDHPKALKAPTKPQNSLSVPETKLDSSKSQKSAEGRPQAVSRIQQGILQASKSRQQALRHQIYGAHNPEVAFAKAAQELAG